MAIVNSVKQILPSFGSPTVYKSNIGASVAAGTSNVTLTYDTPYTASAGKLRVKTNTIGTNATVKTAAIWVNDGTNTVQVYMGDAAATANSTVYDQTFDVLTDIASTNVIVSLTVANNTTTFDVEFAGNP